MKDAAHQVVEAAQHAPGLKVAAGATGVGGATTAISANPDWTTIAGLGLTALGITVSLASLWMGYQTLQERRRENDLKALELGVD
jgi:hypothetical protein